MKTQNSVFLVFRRLFRLRKGVKKKPKKEKKKAQKNTKTERKKQL